jgi:ferritin-like metal-binding protein YciE
MSAIPGKAPSVKRPPQIEQPAELLLEELGQLLTVEETLARVVLPKLVRQQQDDELRAAMQRHLEQTRGHAERVELAFRALGSAPAGKPAPVLDAMRSEHEAQAPTVWGPLRPVLDCGAAMDTERYEIGAYEKAIGLADALGAAEVARLLRANLDEETAALEQLAGHADRLARLAVEQPNPD